MNQMIYYDNTIEHNFDEDGQYIDYSEYKQYKHANYIKTSFKIIEKYEYINRT